MIRGTTPTFQLLIDDETVDLTEARNGFRSSSNSGQHHARSDNSLKGGTTWTLKSI